MIIGFGLVSDLGEGLKKQDFALHRSRDNALSLYLNKSYLEGARLEGLTL